MAVRSRFVVVVVGLVLVLAGPACGGGSADADGHAAVEGYGAELRADFVRRCTEAGTASDVCTCWYAALEAEVPYARFEQMDRRLRSGAGSRAVPADVQALAVGCAADPDQPAAP